MGAFDDRNLKSGSGFSPDEDLAALEGPLAKYLASLPKGVDGLFIREVRPTQPEGWNKIEFRVSVSRNGVVSIEAPVGLSNTPFDHERLREAYKLCTREEFREVSSARTGYYASVAHLDGSYHGYIGHPPTYPSLDGTFTVVWNPTGEERPLIYRNPGPIRPRGSK